ncbi:hypothetical protein NMY22_g8030 [Coprinellus aureogranulatus]|nr:hypothetical protein NMY22_g8030 [Coprinellus aureogranulatus]
MPVRHDIRQQPECVSVMGARAECVTHSARSDLNVYPTWYKAGTECEKHPNIAFYGRYIDDCLALVYGESEASVLEYMSKAVVIDECQIEWNVSEQFEPFLDMLLYKDNANRLQHMPYRKARNHMERIPWISSHPIDVKRGTFIGEMSRLATLSSTFETYREALVGLCSLYEVRGYPAEHVRKWLRDNIANRWNNRLSTSSRNNDTDGVFVLKTSYNTAWNYFSATQLGDAVIGTWKKEIFLSTSDHELKSLTPAERERYVTLYG